ISVRTISTYMAPTLAPNLKPPASPYGRVLSLLPQPGGFEGFGAFPKALDSDHLAPAEGPEGVVTVLRRDAARSSHAAMANAHEHAVSHRDDLLRFHGVVRPGLQQVPRVRRNRLGAIERLVGRGEEGGREFRIQHQDDVGIEQIDAGAEVSLAEPLIH